MRHLVWTGLLMLMCGMRSRLQLLSEGVRPGFHANLLALTGTDEAAAAHPGTLNYLAENMRPETLENLNADLARRLLRMRCLDRFRLNSEWLVAVDATELRTYSRRHCEHCLTRPLANGTTQYFHAVLEARLILANGMTLYLTSVPIQNPRGKYDKQDCEMKAFPRLADKLKKLFPRLPVCLLGDSLYGCEPVFRICRQKRWSYIVVFKKGRTASLWEEARGKCRRRPHNVKTAECSDGTVQHFSWADYLPHGKEITHAVFCNENCADGSEKQWAWVTDHRPDHNNVQTLTNKGGRQRWKIENEGFNTLKNGETGLKHDYGSLGNAWYNYYLLAQVALLLTQLVWCGDTVRKVTGQVCKTTKSLFRTIRNMCARFRESLQTDRLADVNDSINPAAIQIRFDTS